MSKGRVLVVGWDGAPWSYLDPLLARGELPNLASLLERGARGILRSTVPPYTNVAWPSLVTGLNPGKTGVFDGARARPGGYEAVPTNLTGHRGIPLWRWLNRFGWRCGVLNVPMTYPAHPLDGYLVSGFDSPRRSSRIAYPEDLLEAWARAGHPYRVLEEETALMDQQNPFQARGDLEAFVRRWESLTEEQGAFVAWVGRHDPVDLLFVVFSGTDSINHRTRDLEAIARVYRAADRALGRILEAVEADWICLVSDHGSGPAERYIALYRILSDAGWIAFRPQVATRFWRRLPAVGPALARLWPRLPEGLRRLLSWPLLRWEPRLAVAYENVDWSRTRVFARGGMGPLYLNVRGRYPQGTVDPAEYESLRQEVIETFLALRDEAGRPLFARVWRREELYPGADPADDPPDLVFEVADPRDQGITGYPTDPVVRPIPATGEYGGHTPDGIFVLAGPTVRPGVDLGPLRIVDVVPTLLAALNLPIPEPVDGRAVREAFALPVEERRVPVEAEERGSGGEEEGEDQEVLDRLRALGYLD